MSVPLTFSFAPSYGSSAVRKPRLRTITFGDGYEEVARDGINHNPRSFNLQFTKLTNVEAAAISDFLEARGGSESFLWTPWPPYDTIGLFRCKEWNNTPDEYNSVTITAVFEEKFEAYTLV